MPFSSATPRIRACMAANVPSACQRCNQRCVALFDAHCGPRGTSHHRHPVIKTYNNVFNICRNGACGIPRLRLGGAGGKTSSNKRHSQSLTPSNRPAILPSFVRIEQYSTKIILVGYIHGSHTGSYERWTLTHSSGHGTALALAWQEGAACVAP
jgi:hypothetical protein